MKALIFTMTCGQGHNMIAKSLEQAFVEKGVEVKILQIYGFDKNRVEKENKLFLWAVKRIPHTYNFFWNYLRKRDKTFKKLPKYLKVCIPYMKEHINEFKPDIIMCTHSYASNIISYLKTHDMLDKNILTGTILFDSCLAPYWENSKDVDYIFQAHDFSTNALLKKGFKENQIKTFGQPIRDEFYQPFDKLEMRKKLNLPDKFTVIVVSGGGGLGNTLKLAKSILKNGLDINLILVNGKNKKTFNKVEKYIKKKNIKNVFNLGFVTNLDEYMKASDVNITRCGGSAVAENISLKLPMIIREKLILNEKVDKKTFVDNGCALGLDKLDDAGDKVEYLYKNKNAYNNIIKNMEKYINFYSTKKIINFLAEEQKKLINNLLN